MLNYITQRVLSEKMSGNVSLTSLTVIKCQKSLNLELVQDAKHLSHVMNPGHWQSLGISEFAKNFVKFLFIQHLESVRLSRPS